MTVDWAYSLDDSVGGLAMCEELAAGTGEEQEHTVSGLEFLWLSRAVVGTLLLSSGC